MRSYVCHSSCAQRRKGNKKMAATERVTSFRCSKDIDKQKRVIKTKNEEQVGSPHVFFLYCRQRKGQRAEWQTRDPSNEHGNGRATHLTHTQHTDTHTHTHTQRRTETPSGDWSTRVQQTIPIDLLAKGDDNKGRRRILDWTVLAICVGDGDACFFCFARRRRWRRIKMAPRARYEVPTDLHMSRRRNSIPRYRHASVSATASNNSNNSNNNNNINNNNNNNDDDSRRGHHQRSPAFGRHCGDVLVQRHTHTLTHTLTHTHTQSVQHSRIEARTRVKLVSSPSQQPVRGLGLAHRHPQNSETTLVHNGDRKCQKKS